jgi:hypothetical protein
MADADSDDAVEPVVFPLGRLEQWIDAEVMGGWLDHFAPLDPVDYPARSVADSPVRHRDENAIIRPQHQSDVQRRRANRRSARAICTATRREGLREYGQNVREIATIIVVFAGRSNRTLWIHYLRLLAPLYKNGPKSPPGGPDMKTPKLGREGTS